jgi:hypothetical protein
MPLCGSDADVWSFALLIPAILGGGRTELPLKPLSEFARPALWPNSGGSWSWTGPNDFTSTVREIDNIALTAGANVYTATFTFSGCSSTQAFTVTVN